MIEAGEAAPSTVYFAVASAVIVSAFLGSFFSALFLGTAGSGAFVPLSADDFLLALAGGLTLLSTSYIIISTLQEHLSFFERLTSTLRRLVGAVSQISVDSSEGSLAEPLRLNPPSRLVKRLEDSRGLSSSA